MQHVLLHFQSDDKITQVLATTHLRLPKTNDDVYLMLLKAIVEQQLSTKAAATIWIRFLGLFDGYPTPDRVLNTSPDRMRACGLSFPKAGYIHNIAHHTLRNDLSVQRMAALSDDEALSELTQIKGVGRWTAEMILMFSLGRTDVFPVDDLIIRNAMIQLYGIESIGRQQYKDLEAIASNWSPYRSYACFLLWDWYEGQVKGRPLYGN